MTQQIILTRKEAECIVEPFTDLIRGKSGKGIKGVQLRYCCFIFERYISDGTKRLALLRSDPIRNLGPTPEHIYPWNIIDYLTNIDPRKKTTQ